jgi:hypothetical protein
MLQKWIAGISLAVLGAGLAQAEYCEVPPDQVLSSIVRIEGENTEGSGIVVAPARVLTAAHVVMNISNPMVRINGVQRPATVMFVNQSKDFALLEVSTGGRYVIPLRQMPLEEADTVWAVGFPLGGEQVVNQGEYEGLIEDGTLHTTASVDHGQSGGGLISCEQGRHVLAGMTTGFGAIRAGGEVIRLDDYSVSLSSMDIAPLMQADQYQAVAYVGTYEQPEVREPYYEEYIPEATMAGFNDDNYDPTALSKLGSAEFFPYLYYEEHP